MQNIDKGMSSTILTGRGILVEIAHNSWTHGILLSNFAYSYIFTLSRHMHAKPWLGFAFLFINPNKP